MMTLRSSFYTEEALMDLLPKTSMKDVTTKDPISPSLKVSMDSSLAVTQVSVGNH